MESKPLLPVLDSSINSGSARRTNSISSSGGANGGILALSLLALLSILQGLSWAPFSSLPTLSQQLFSFDDGTLTWQQNANNIGQAVMMPLVRVVLHFVTQPFLFSYFQS